MRPRPASLALLALVGCAANPPPVALDPALDAIRAFCAGARPIEINYGADSVTDRLAGEIRAANIRARRLCGWPD